MWLDIPYLDSMGWISYNPTVFVPQTWVLEHLQVCPWSTYCVSIGQFGAIGESRSGIEKMYLDGLVHHLRLESMVFLFWNVYSETEYPVLWERCYSFF